MKIDLQNISRLQLEDQLRTFIRDKQIQGESNKKGVNIGCLFWKEKRIG